MSNNSLSKEHKQMSKKVSKASTPEPVAPVVAAPVAVAAAEPAKKVVVRKAKEATPAPAPVVVAAPAPVEATPAVVPVAEKKPRKTKEAAPVAVAPVVAAPVVEAVAEPVVEAVAETSVETQLASVVTATETLQKDVQSLASLLRRAVKAYGRERRVADKEVARAQRKRARKEGTEASKKPTSFQTPKAISSQLCEFLGVAAGTPMARTEVTKAIGKYIKEHGLQNTENKRKFTPDSKLSKLFGPLQAKHKEKGFEYFNLQTYLAPHFPKSA